MKNLASVEPIIYGVLNKSSMIDFEGHMCRVFFTAGCNFRCGYCHNPGMIRAVKGNLSWDDVGHLLEKAHEEWTDAVCISGGEPLLHEELKEVILFFKDKGFLVKLDTNGSFPDRLAAVSGLVDYIAMDYKASLDRYTEVAGVKVNTDTITASVQLLKERGEGEYEIRTTIVEQIHDEEHMRTISQELKGITQYILQPFVPQKRLYSPEFSVMKRTNPAFLERIKQVVEINIPNTLIRGVGL